MRAVRAVVLASLVVAWMVVPSLALPVGHDSHGAQSVDDTVVQSVGTDASSLAANDSENETNATFGEQVSGFMQQQTSQASGEVESGIWSAGFDGAPPGQDRAALVDQRTEDLRAELSALQDERRELIEARQSGEISQLEFRSRMSGLLGEYASLLSAIEETEPRARQAGGNVTAVEDLRGTARNDVGNQFGAVAGNGVVTPPGLANGTDDGPPTDVPGQNRTTGNGNESIPGNAPGQNGNAPGNNVTDGLPGNGTGPGNGNVTGNGTGNGTGPGNGNVSNPDRNVTTPVLSDDVILGRT